MTVLSSWSEVEVKLSHVDAWYRIALLTAGILRIGVYCGLFSQSVVKKYQGDAVIQTQTITMRW